GCIEIRLEETPGGVVITYQDDGGGLDLGRIRTRAHELGFASKSQCAACSPAELAAFIFRPAFSTALETNQVSGRGTGLDAVAHGLAAFGGKIGLVLDDVKEERASFHFVIELPPAAVAPRSEEEPEAPSRGAA